MATKRELVPGECINRTYEDRNWVLKAEKDGTGKTIYKLGDKSFKSLSSAAGYVTGRPTSGPYFWGLGWGERRKGKWCNAEEV